MRNLWKLISPYWRSEEKYKAFGLFMLLIGFNLASVYVAVMLNQWSSGFYNALQELNKDIFVKECGRFFWIVALLISVFLANYYILSILKFRWRRWLTEHYIARWLTEGTHYRLKLKQTATDNPDQRISQDLASFADGVLSLFTSFFKETVTLISFVGILWAISGPLQFTLLGKAIVIPGYMVWAALIYAIIGTSLIFKIGKPIVRLDFEQEKFEANFRYALVRFREKGEEIAIYRGEKIEEDNFRHSFKDIANNFYKILKRQMYIICSQNFYNNMTIIFPVVAASPLFFSKMITLGVLMQIRGAFSEVQGSFSVLINNFQVIASLRATTQRLLEFSAAIDMLAEEDAGTIKSKALGKVKTDSMYAKTATDAIHADILQTSFIPDSLYNNSAATKTKSFGNAQNEAKVLDTAIALNPTFNCRLEMENLTLTTPHGKPLISNFNLTVHSGEKVLIMGRSGLGKTTILRAISGVWPFGQGTIHVPTNLSILLIPQRPYLPMGSLREAVLYPKDNLTVPDEEIEYALQRCRLEHLYEHLDEVQDWSHRLSLGEQQRIIFVRAIIQKPEWIIMDEPTAAMDKETENMVYRALFEHMPEVTLITIGHSPSLKTYHTRVVDLDLESETQVPIFVDVPELQGI